VNVSAPEPAREKHLLANVQGLRAIAALLVVLVHASLPDVGVESVLAKTEAPWLGPFTNFGLFGVDLFFVISGFIMLVTNWSAFGRPRAGITFFVRRVIRIYPPYWLALSPVLLVLMFAKHLMTKHVGVKTGILESLLLLPTPNHFVLTVAWTLVWEMLFYVVFAFLLRIDRKHVVGALALWFVAQIVLYLTLTGSPNFYLNFASTPLPLEFIFGAAAGVLYIKRWFPAPRLAAGFGLLAALGAWAAVSMNNISLENINDIRRIVIFGVPAALLVYGGVALEVRAVFSAPRWAAAAGDASYAIYLWHMSILVIVRQAIVRLHPGGFVAHGIVLLLTVAIIVAFGLAVFRFFERPVTSYLNGLLVRRVFGSSLRAPKREQRAFGLIEE
jgi:peptidoglycan/LPS O-acetylase OafA/YrhL